MSISVTCPSCSARLNIPDNSGGVKLKCPKCGGQFVAKAPSQAGFTLPAAGPRGSRAAAAPGSASQAAWYCARGKQRVGPLSSAQLQQMAISGQLKSSDMILQAGTATLAPRGSAKGLFAAGSRRDAQLAGQPGTRGSSVRTTPRRYITPPRGCAGRGDAADREIARRRVWPWLTAAAVLLLAGGTAGMLALDPLGWKETEGRPASNRLAAGQAYRQAQSPYHAGFAVPTCTKRP